MAAIANKQTNDYKSVSFVHIRLQFGEVVAKGDSRHIL